MILQIPNTFSSAQLTRCRQALDAASWTEGTLADRVVAQDLRDGIVKAAEAQPKFISAALPVKILPPAFYRYESSQELAATPNRAIRIAPGTSERIRADLSAVMFLSSPDDYGGGEITLKDPHGEQMFKLPAGHLFLFPSTFLQRTRPVTRGICFHAAFWIQSMVRDAGQRKILFDLDCAIRQLADEVPDHPSATKLYGVYHNLLRYWAEV